MGLLTLHHYGILTSSTSEWLSENEVLLGKPFKISHIIKISSQKADITFVEQKEGEVLTELVEPWQDNHTLNKLIEKGVSAYHKGYLLSAGEFDEVVEMLVERGFHSLGIFQSEAFGNRRCVFLVTINLGMIEIIEQ